MANKILFDDIPAVLQEILEEVRKLGQATEELLDRVDECERLLSKMMQESQTPEELAKQLPPLDCPIGVVITEPWRHLILKT